MSDSNSNKSTRIPPALQAVFIASNSGDEVMQAPDGNIATKVFPSLAKQRKRGKSKFSIPKITVPFKKDKRKSSIYQLYTDEANDTDETFLMSSISLEEESAKKIVQSKKSTVEHPKTVVARDPQQPMNPQDYLMKLLRARGYSVVTTCTLDSGYHSEPTPLQQASYHSHLINLAREGKNNKLKQIMECGVSPNPCNKFGESLVHTVCRRCKPETLRVLLDAGTSLQVCDDYGRTPLHDACWRPEPCFELIEMIANEDLDLFHTMDIRGHVPLSYITHEEHWDQWNAFLDSKIDLWWPPLESSKDKKKLVKESARDLRELPPFSHTIADPKNALELEIAAMVTAGRIAPEQAVLMNDAYIITHSAHGNEAEDGNEKHFHHDSNECSDTEVVTEDNSESDAESDVVSDSSYDLDYLSVLDDFSEESDYSDDDDSSYASDGTNIWDDASFMMSDDMKDICALNNAFKVKPLLR